MVILGNMGIYKFYHNRFIFQMYEVSELWPKAMVNMFIFAVLKWRPVLGSPKLKKQMSRWQFQNLNTISIFSIWATVP